MGNETQNLINLVTDAQNGVAGAFDNLYHESFMHAYYTASLLLKNEQDIEDVLQNSYMYVAKYIRDLKNPESFNNWLSVIVKHECQKYISKQKRASDIFTAVKKTAEFELIDNSNLPHDYIEKSETRDAIQRIIDNLPQDKRACIVLFYYEQLSLTEISEILGVPEGTVMSRLYYARKKLEKEFKKLQKKDESLFGISVIPLILSLFVYKEKTLAVPPAIKSGVIAAITSAEVATASSALTGTSTATAGGSYVGVSTASSAAAGSVVAGKVAAVAVAASVAVGGGIATINHIKNNNEVITTLTSTESIVEYATVIVSSSENASVTDAILSTTYISSGFTAPHIESTTESNISEQNKTTSSAEISSTAVSTTKQVTTKATTITTTKPTITQKETTTVAANVFNVSDGVLSEYTGNEHNVSIPQNVDSSTVTAIGTGAFMGNTKITSVSIPSTVTRIGMEAFSDCINLKSISLPSSLNSIGVAAFYGCASLTSIKIPDGTKTISDEAFSYCDNLTNITIPDSVTSISEDAFYGSENVTIKCTENSAAHNYAVENSIKFELI